MTTAATSLLGLALPVTGELSGTWGDTVNNSITSLLDSAIAGTTTLSADSDVTLTTTTLATNQARQAILLWTASGTVTRNITAPAQSKIYTVINKTGSTQSIVLRGAGPTTGVTIVAGESAVCAWNGTDFIKISNTSGAGVFTTLSVSGAATFSGGTANGVAYLNGSKVLTTGSGLVFDGTNLGLGVTPSAWSTASGRKVLQVGSGSAVAHFAGGGGVSVFSNNVYFDGTNNVYINTGVAQQYIQSSSGHVWNTAASGTAGNAVTFTQAMALSASSELNIDSGTGGGRLTFTPGATYNQILSTTTSFGAYNILRYQATQHQWFNSAGTQAMTLDASGNLVVGTTSASARLESVASLSAFRAAATEGSMIFRQFGGSTSSGVTELHMRANTGKSTYLTFTEDAIDDRWSVGIQNGNGALRFIQGTPSTGTERARIDSGGNLLVGTTSEQGKVTIVNSDTNKNSLNTQATNASGPNYGYTHVNTAAASSGGAIIRGFSSNGAVQDFNVAGNGNVTNANNSYGAISDVNRKENVVDVTPKLNKLNQVRIVNYNMIGDEQKQIGVIAQELEQIFPGMVDESTDRDIDGNDLGTTTKSVKYSVFVPMLIKAIQEQQVIIQQLQADVASLKA